ncbi:MAG: hypothetical protein M0Z41_13960 [Peptococcaceae bacterium]|jgi:hypothetical protein|nr:hypothetical protein [Peptococcaceae bacterium]
MRIILESGLERYAWQVMMEAHRKWEKNHGDTLRDAMGWSFDILNKEDTDEAVKAEVERRLEAEYADDLTVTQSDYIRHGMSAYDVEEMDEDERYQLHLDLTYEYGELLGEITDRREELMDTVKDKLRQVYYTFFNAPENLTVVFNGEIIQGAKE